MHLTASSVGQWLKQRRKALDLTQDELARSVGCSVATIRKIEAGERQPSLQIAKRLAAYLDADHDNHQSFLHMVRPDLCLDEDPPPAPEPERTQNRRACAPIQPTPIIGRERELADVRHLIQETPARLITLLGPAGVGKTRMLLQLADELQHEWADGCIFVALAPVIQPEIVLDKIAQALGCDRPPKAPSLDALIECVGNRKLLLLLDNFEQVLSAAPLLAELLAACSGIKIVVTSRAPLNLRWERCFPVSLLAVPNLSHLPSAATIASYPAVALFVERAQAVNPAFQFTHENAAILAEICVRLEGLPLAIELAAARINVLSFSEILARLNSRLSLLTSGACDLPQRQQSLRAAIDWSYNLLGPAEQQLFIQVAVFVGGWTLPAAEAIGGPHVLCVLESLVAKSLVVKQEQPDGSTRFTMLEMLHEYALERFISSESAEMWRAQHASFYQTLALSAEPELRGPHQAAWITTLEQDHDNLRAALTWAVSRGQADLALSMSGALYYFWLTRGHLCEGRRWLEQALALESPQSLPARAKALIGAGVLLFEQGKPDQAQACYEESLALRRQQNDTRGVAQSLLCLADLEHYRKNDPQQYLDESLALFRTLGDTQSVAYILERQAVALIKRGEWAQAQTLYDECFVLYQAVEDRRSVATVFLNRGGIHRSQNEYGAAAAAYEYSLALFQDLGDTRGVAIAETELAMLAYLQSDHLRARVLSAEALAIFHSFDHQLGIATNLALIAIIEQAERRDIQAVLLCGAVMRLLEAIHIPLFPDYATAFHKTLAMLRETVDEASFTRAWASGLAADTAHVVADVLAELQSAA